MTLGLLAWSVFCLGLALYGSSTKGKPMVLSEVLTSFGSACCVWAFAYGVWLVVRMF